MNSNKMHFNKALFVGLLAVFIYVSPLGMVNEPTSPTSPAIGLALFVVGAVAWVLQTLAILVLVHLDSGRAKKLSQLAKSGHPTLAEVLETRTVGLKQGRSTRQLRLRFTNLSGHVVTDTVEVTDSRYGQQLYQPGDHVEIRLNTNRPFPPYALAGEYYEARPPLLGWLWVIFNIVYAIGLFMVTVYLHEGDGFTFLSFTSPWVWAPLLGLSIILFAGFSVFFRTGSGESAEHTLHTGELLLYGISTPGEITGFWRTGMMVNEDFVMKFAVQFLNQNGDLEERILTRHVSPLVDSNRIETGPVEVTYIPHKPKLIDANLPGTPA